MHYLTVSFCEHHSVHKLEHLRYKPEARHHKNSEQNVSEKISRRVKHLVVQECGSKVGRNHTQQRRKYHQHKNYRNLRLILAEKPQKPFENGRALDAVGTEFSVGIGVFLPALGAKWAVFRQRSIVYLFFFHRHIVAAAELLRFF